MSDKNGFPELEKANEVYFEYKDEKSRTRKWKIADVSYKSYFDCDTEERVDG